MIRACAPLACLAIALAGCSALSPPSSARLDGVGAPTENAPEVSEEASAAVAPAEPPSTQAGGAGAPPPSDAMPPLGEERSVLYAVHLASYRTEAAAVRGWAVLRSAAPGTLAGLEPRLETVDIGERGVFLRLKAGPLPNQAEAEARCAALQSEGYFCQALDFTGRALPG